MMKSVLFSITVSLLSLPSESCEPIHLVMTRASGSRPTYSSSTGRLELKYPPSSVNMANIHGALKYVQTETIDNATGYQRCERKNKVSQILFFNVTVCNPDPSIAYFNAPPHDFNEFGAFLSMDNGQCHAQDTYCSQLEWTALGPFVGFQNQSADVRAPTHESYWYSLPGECPTQAWSSKTPECKTDHPGGRCPTGKQPDGKQCTWAAEFLGHVELDELIGIRTRWNNQTQAMFQSSFEYCQAGHVEFQRDASTYEFIDGLDFWKDPLNPSKNAWRVQQLVDMYHNRKLYPHNMPLPDSNALNRLNPSCTDTLPECRHRACARDSSQHCINL